MYGPTVICAAAISYTVPETLFNSWRAWFSSLYIQNLPLGSATWDKYWAVCADVIMDRPATATMPYRHSVYRCLNLQNRWKQVQFSFRTQSAIEQLQQDNAASLNSLILAFVKCFLPKPIWMYQFFTNPANSCLALKSFFFIHYLPQDLAMTAAVTCMPFHASAHLIRINGAAIAFNIVVNLLNWHSRCHV